VINSNRLFQTLARSPLLWGGAASIGFYALVHRGVLGSHFFQRYCAGHPVNYVEVVLFFIGLAALAVKFLDIVAQTKRLNIVFLDPVPRGGQTVNDSGALLTQLEQAPAAWQDDYLVCRLRNALEHVRRSESSEGLEEHLRYLSDVDAGKQHAGYSFVRLVIWAIPILGFLGTVIGITMALGNLAPKALEESLHGVMGGLAIAFDTTALALGLSMILMFVQYEVDRRESALLNLVDLRVEGDLVGRFEEISDGPDGQLLAVRRMVEALIQSTEQLVKQQTELWWSTVDAAQQRWNHMTDIAGKQLQTALANALDENLKTHARELLAHEESMAEKNRRNWERVQQALLQNTETVASLQKAVVQKAELINRAVESTGQVTRLEEALNRNLSALAGSKNFEQTVMSLAAAIHLLTSRLTDMPAEAPTVQLEPRRTGQAA